MCYVSNFMCQGHILQLSPLLGIVFFEKKWHRRALKCNVREYCKFRVDASRHTFSCVMCDSAGLFIIKGEGG